MDDEGLREGRSEVVETWERVEGGIAFFFTDEEPREGREEESGALETGGTRTSVPLPV